MLNNQSILSLIRQRYSCRSYQRTPIPLEKQVKLRDFLTTLSWGPMRTPTRFQLLAADESDRQEISGLTTYGFIKNPTGYIMGAVSDKVFNLEDFGYLLEYAVLYATSLDLGTVWLGGTFNKGRFVKRMQLAEDEQLPAVVATGLIADNPRFVDAIMRRQVNAKSRKSWRELFLHGDLDTPLTRKSAGQYAEILDMVQYAPSASNKQPWRIVKEGNNWHFYMNRYRIYHPRNTNLVGIADMQRIDMGIAMSHFELSAEELGLNGHWAAQKPEIHVPDPLTEYTVTWCSDSN